MHATQPISDCQNYDKTRAFLCESFRANPSVYYKRLTSLRRQGTDSYKMFLSRLRDLQDHYLQSKNISTFDQLKQDNLFHLFMDALLPEVKAFVLTREAETPSDAAKYADLHYSVVSQNCDRTKEDRRLQNSRRPGAEVNDRKLTLQTDASAGIPPPKPALDCSPSPENEASASKAKGACFICRSTEHKKLQCPQYKAKTKSANNFRQQPAALVQNLGRSYSEDMFVIPIHIMGIDRPLVAYRDTGTYVSLVNAAFVNACDYTGDTITVSGVFGPPTTIPTAKIRVKSPKFCFHDYVTIEVGVVETDLPFASHLLLGNSVYLLNKQISDIITVTDLNNGFLPLNRQVNESIDVSRVSDRNTDSSSVGVA